MPFKMFKHLVGLTVHCSLVEGELIDHALHSAPAPVGPTVLAEGLGLLWIGQHRAKCHEEVAPQGGGNQVGLETC